ncbi:MAG: PASTA domain-containing protein, partial [Solobacterium sp.]|nr:PASTA domain-containing protein [Solobacterium sp.]
GDSIIDQYPRAGSIISTGQKVFLLLDTNSFIMPDMTGWTRKDVTGLWSVTQFGFKLTGEGTVSEQSIPPGATVARGTEIEVVFK